MSTWTSSRGAAARLQVLALPLLAACVAATAGPPTVTLGEGPQAFVVAAPAGYCTAPRAVTTTGRSAFAAFARCTGGASSPLLTATVAEPGSAAVLDPVALAAFFTAPEGRRTLSRTGDPRSVTVHEVVAVDGAVLIRMTDAAPGAPGPGPSWRAVMTAGSRLVTLSVTGGPGAALTRDEGRALAVGFVGAVRRANGSAA